MTDLSDCMSVGFTTQQVPTHVGPKTNLESRFEKAGIAGATKTQLVLRKTSPWNRPDWLCELMDGRRSWKNRTTHIARLYEVSLVLTPPHPDWTIQEVKHG